MKEVTFQSHRNEGQITNVPTVSDTMANVDTQSDNRDLIKTP